MESSAVFKLFSKRDFLCCQRTLNTSEQISSQKHTKIKAEWKRLKTTNTGVGSKGQEYFKAEGETPKTPSGSVEVVKAQTSIEKGGPLLSVEAKFITSVSCFWRTDQEALQDLWKPALRPALRRRPSEKE